MSKPTVAILFIATGRYIVFWEYFFKSAQENLLKDCDKHYFLFTDYKKDLVGDESGLVTRIYQDKLGWPFDTLLRFEMFLKIRNYLINYDYIFFFNGNSEIVQPIFAKDLLPLADNENYVFVHQPHMFHKSRNKFTYDRNPESSAYIPYGKGIYYFAGGLNGGKSKAYIEMCEQLHTNIMKDLEKNIIALWHDESHLNHFALDRTDIKILPPYFTKGEKEYWKNNAKVMFSDKTHYRFGGHAYLRGESKEKIKRDDWEKQHALNRKRKHFGFRIKQYVKSLFL